MDDLISRSKLLKEIETWGGCVESLHEYISNMPTAYDVDAVVAELEKKAEQCRNLGFVNKQKGHSGIANNCYRRRVDFLKAIDIVRNAGKDGASSGEKV